MQTGKHLKKKLMYRPMGKKNGKMTKTKTGTAQTEREGGEEKKPSKINISR